MQKLIGANAPIAPTTMILFSLSILKASSSNCSLLVITFVHFLATPASLLGRCSRYAQIEKELLAISFACVRFHQYVYGKINFTVETDHRPLINLFSKDAIINLY